MKPTRKVLCLDFDGVICNSIDECLLVAYNSYMKFENRHSEQVLIIDDIMKNIYHRFHQHRYLVRPAKDYWVLLDLVLGNQHISKEEFQLKKINNEDRLNSFETIFFKTRKEFQINNFESWIKMNRLYDNFLDGWREVSSVFDVYIVTNKNKNSVETILKYNKISILDDHIYSKETFVSKLDALNEITSITGSNKNDLIFIDDSAETILEINDFFPKSYLANWGYDKEVNDKSNRLSVDSLLDLFKQ